MSSCYSDDICSIHGSGLCGDDVSTGSSSSLPGKMTVDNGSSRSLSSFWFWTLRSSSSWSPWQRGRLWSGLAGVLKWAASGFCGVRWAAYGEDFVSVPHTAVYTSCIGWGRWCCSSCRLLWFVHGRSGRWWCSRKCLWSGCLGRFGIEGESTDCYLELGKC